MSQANEKKLSLEVRRIRASSRAGIVDDYANCKPRTLGFWGRPDAAPEASDAVEIAPSVEGK
ncbi:hypothetical protein A7982_13707 [Minicystis rosea]|nr:hypothetical protein A7982_13707 [Minicystis rosea]